MQGPLFDLPSFLNGQNALGIVLGLTTQYYIWVPYALLTMGLNSIESESYFYTEEGYIANYPLIFEDVAKYQNSGIDPTDIHSISQEIDPDLFMKVYYSPTTSLNYGRFSGFEFEVGFYNDNDITGEPFDGEYMWKYKIEFSVVNGFLGMICDPQTGHTTGQIYLNKDYSRIRYGSNITVSC